MDYPRDQPARVRPRDFTRFDRPIQDPMVTYPQAMPRCIASQRLDVKVDGAGGQPVQPLAYPRQLGAAPNALQIAHGAAGEDERGRSSASATFEFGENLICAACPSRPKVAHCSACRTDELRGVGQHVILELVRIERHDRRYRPAVAGDDRRTPGANYLVDDLAGTPAKVADADCRHVASPILDCTYKCRTSTRQAQAHQARNLHAADCCEDRDSLP